MNRRDAALIAHLDAIESRMAARFDHIDGLLFQILSEIAGLKVELATHGHDPDD